MGGPGSDQAYSSGVEFSYIFADTSVPGWSRPFLGLRNLLGVDVDKAKTNYGISIGQQIYTPNNTDLKNPPPDDRPYAAWLYANFYTHIKTPDRGYFLGLALGMIGPSAQGEQVQNDFHGLIGDLPAEGWSHQLNDEATVQLSFEERIKWLQLFSRSGRYFDVLPYYGGGLGNVYDQLHVGGVVRVGYNIPDDLGPGRPSAGNGTAFVPPTASSEYDHDFGFYVYAGGTANAWERNIFLDGNTFRASPHVTKYPFTTETEVGAGAQWLPWSVVWRFVVRSPEFEQLSKFNSFASVNLTYVL